MSKGSVLIRCLVVFMLIFEDRSGLPLTAGLGDGLEIAHRQPKQKFN
jgi:hypothetical protein